MSVHNVRMERRSLVCFVFVICFSLPAALLLNFLGFYKYSPLLPETIVLFVAFAMLSLVFSGLAWMWRPVGVLFVVLVLLFYLRIIINDQIIAIITWVNPFFHSIHPLAKLIVKLGTAVIIVITFYLLVSGMGVQGWRGLTVASLVILASTTITWWTSVPPPRTTAIIGPKEGERHDLPPLVYIIFDEHMGIKWTPEDIPNAQTAKRKMLKFYSKFDFLLFTDAFSHYFDSQDSISNTLNLSAEPTPVGLEINRKGRSLVRNKVFEILKGMGYRIRVYQSEYMNFCDSSDKGIESCLEYGNNSIRDLQGADIQTGHKTLLIIGHWLSAMKIYDQVFNPLRWLAFSTLDKEYLIRVPFFGNPYNRVGPLNVMPVLENIRSDITRYPRSTAFFAHILMPHYPYVYDDQGTLKKNPRTWLGPNEWYNSKYPPPRSEVYRSYYGQVLGLYQWLEIWFDELREKGQLQDMIVIFHGDHGSRICDVEPSVSTMSHPNWNRIVKDGFSTLFAVKDPRIPKGRIGVAKPIDILLQEFFFHPKILTKSTPEGLFLLLKSDSSNILKKYSYEQR